MPITLQWDNDNQTVLRTIFWNHWTMEELNRQVNPFLMMLNSVDHIVDVLVDLRSGSYMPKEISVPLFRQAIDQLPQNVGIIVFVNDDATHQRMFNVFESFERARRPNTPRRLFMVQTLTDANIVFHQHHVKRNQRLSS